MTEPGAKGKRPGGSGPSKAATSSLRRS